MSDVKGVTSLVLRLLPKSQLQDSDEQTKDERWAYWFAGVNGARYCEPHVWTIAILSLAASIQHVEQTLIVTAVDPAKSTKVLVVAQVEVH